MFDFVHFFNNLLLHHTAVGLGAIAHEEPGGRRIVELGSSKTYIRGALGGAYFSYGNTLSLVLVAGPREALDRLYGAHLNAFVRVR